MARQIRIVLATLVALVAIDALVALALPRAPGALRNFFEYGRSVPGKIAEWQVAGSGSGNLLGVAWRPDILAQSATDFAAEDPTAGPVIRSYGMSFTQQLLGAAQELRPGLLLDQHNGPAAPPNFAYAVMLDDRENRRAGDIVVIGILSSSLPALGSFSNRVWNFEQPAPFTYPVFRPAAAGGLERRDPVLTSLAELDDPAKATAFDAQMQAEDDLWSAAAFSLPALDTSPFARLLRRKLASGAINAREAQIISHPLDGAMPWAEVLQRMVRETARLAREDGQIPLVVLIQARGTDQPQLAAALRPTLEAEGIPYLATEDIADPRDASAFLPDGHFTPATNRKLAEKMLAMPELGPQSGLK